MKKNNNNKVPSGLVATTEFATAILSNNLTSESSARLEADAKGYVYSDLNLEFDSESVSLSVVRNGGGVMNLVLPYYSALDSLDNFSAGIASDSDLGDISGGEIFIVATITAAIAVGSVGAISIRAGVNSEAGKNFDGSPK